MPLPLRCRCGRLQGEVALEGAYTRATCYCRDCRAFAKFLGGEGIANAQGGTDIVPMDPAGLRFTSGVEQLACMSMSPRGLLRWYAACCRTPVGNTGRDARQSYVGVITACIDANEEVLTAQAGPRDRIALFRKHARGKVAATPLRLVSGGLSIMAHVVAARLRGRRDAVFFDAQGAPIRAPHIVSKQEREVLQS